MSNPSERQSVCIVEREGHAIAALLVRKGQRLALAQRLREHFRIELPEGPHRTAVGDLSLIGVGPDAWLATCERGTNLFALSLAQVIGDLASVCDQSDGYVLLRLSGPQVREVLCRLIPIDVHERAFEVGRVAATVAGHIGVTVWRLEDGADGSAVFELIVFRSF